MTWINQLHKLGENIGLMEYFLALRRLYLQLGNWKDLKAKIKDKSPQMKKIEWGTVFNSINGSQLI